MKLILLGLPPETTLQQLGDRMSRFGPVHVVDVVREGDPAQPWFIVDMCITPDTATEIARRIEGAYFKGRFVRAWVMLHR